jgi:hypothetical protein
MLGNHDTEIGPTEAVHLFGYNYETFDPKGDTN